MGISILWQSQKVLTEFLEVPYKEMGNYRKAENMYIRALQIVPNRHYPLYLLMKLYKDNGQTEKAKKNGY